MTDLSKLLDELADDALYCPCWNQTVSESCRGVCPEWDGFSDQNNLTCHDCGRKITDNAHELFAVLNAAEEVLKNLPLLDENERWDASITALRAAVNAAKEEGHNELEDY